MCGSKLVPLSLNGSQLPRGDMMDVFRNMTILSLEQATVLPYLSYRLAMDGMKVIRLEHPV